MKPLLGVREKISGRLDFALGLSGILVAVAIWCFLTYGGHLRPLFLPSPSQLYESLAEFNSQGWLLSAIWRSFIRVSLALVIVIAIGVPIGILMGAFTPVDALLRKLVNGAKSVPTTGLVGLIVLWFSIEEKAKIVFLFLGSIFYMIILVRQAVRSVNEDFLKVAIDIGATRWQLIWKILLPGALPAIWEAIAVCNGIMWTYIVLAEFINNSEDQIGVGYLLYIGSRTQESGKVFGILLVVAIISASTDWLLGVVKRRFFAWS
ncbi:MAG: ABC transporter permease [Fimbriimonadaceae bacterium]|nr:ABC transporter permease [Fimbriimonadaceae bacterium]